MDNLTSFQRSHCMSQIRSKNTLVEIKFRKLIWGYGIRGYRVNARLKGKPDLYYPAKNIAVFLDGCFWHKCPNCFIKPKSRKSYWDQKIESNVQRDILTTKLLQKEGLYVIRFWEHEIRKDAVKCLRKLASIYEKKVKDN